VYPPVFSALWTKDSASYLPEGPGVDSEGNLYYTHILPFYGTTQNTLLVSLDAETGERRWELQPGQIGQGGSPLVLLHPVHGEVVYSGGAESIVAVRASDGSVLWRTDTGITIDTSYTNEDGQLIQVENKTDGSMVPFSMKLAIDYHMWGLNYHPATDSLLALYSNGTMRVLDRETGQLLSLADGSHPRVGGAKARANDELPNDQELIDYANEAFLEGFVRIHPGLDDDDMEGDFINDVVAAVLGGESQISNYFSIDPNTNSVWLASTMEDEADGVEDGIADWGGLFRYELERDGDNIVFTKMCERQFPGGSASTPTVRADGQRVYIADSFDHVLAIDFDCQVRWELDIGAQALGSLALSSVGNELYVSTGAAVKKILIQPETASEPESAALAWESNISDGYLLDGDNLNALVSLINLVIDDDIPYAVDVTNMQISGIADNGVIIQTAVGVRFNEEGATETQIVPLVIATNLLDRKTGEMVNATPADEESISVITSAGNGSVFTANSPIRRAFTRGMVLKKREESTIAEGMDVLDSLIPPIGGGITRFYPKERFDLFARDASCSASSRLNNSINNYLREGLSSGVKLDRLSTQSIIDQARHALETAKSNGELRFVFTAARLWELDKAEEALSEGDATTAASWLATNCDRLDSHIDR
jgi:outer membrane protein assembly factor BamB